MTDLRGQIKAALRTHRRQHETSMYCECGVWADNMDAHRTDTVTRLVQPDLDRYEEVLGDLNETLVERAKQVADMERSRDEWQWRAEDAERRVGIQRERAERAEAELNRLRAGEEDGYDPRCMPTPGQWIKRYNNATAEQRLDQVTRLTAAAEQGHACAMSLHEERIQEGRDAAATAARARALRDRWLFMTLEPGQVRRLLDELTAVLDGPAATEATKPEEQS